MGSVYLYNSGRAFYDAANKLGISDRVRKSGSGDGPGFNYIYAIDDISYEAALEIKKMCCSAILCGFDEILNPLWCCNICGTRLTNCTCELPAVAAKISKNSREQ